MNHANIEIVKKSERNNLRSQEICFGDGILLNAYLHFQQSWITDQELIGRASHLFSNNFLYRGEPCMTIMIKSGYLGYSKTLNEAGRSTAPHERLLEFITAYLSMAMVVFRFRLTDIDSGEHWDISCDCSLTLWLDGRNISVDSCYLEDEIFASLLYAKVVPRNMKLVMDRFHHKMGIMRKLMKQANDPVLPR